MTQYPHADLAKGIAALGRHGDDSILHVSKTELAIMDAVTPGGLTTNPHTGQKEAFFWLLPLLSGLGTWAATGDFKKGLTSGLLGLATGGLGSLFGGGSAAASTAASSVLDGAKTATDVAGTVGNLAGAVNPIVNAAGNLAPVAKLAAGELATNAAGGLIPQGLGAIGSGFDAIKPIADVAAKTGGANGILGAGMNMLREHPMAAATLGSALLSGMGKQKTPKEGDAPDIPKSLPTPREHIPFDSTQYDPTPSTYLPGEPGSYGPDDIYHYGQYGGERQMFNPPAGPITIAPGTGPGSTTDSSSSGSGSAHQSIFDIMRDEFDRRRQHRAGGGPVDGPGDGKSDSIPMAGPGGQPYALSAGEHIISADTVAALGNGSSEAGHRRLDNMMHKIRTRAYAGGGKMGRVGKVTI